MIYCFEWWLSKPEADTLLYKYHMWAINIEADTRIYLIDIVYEIDTQRPLIWYIPENKEVITIWGQWFKQWSFRDFMDCIKYHIKTPFKDLFQLI